MNVDRLLIGRYLPGKTLIHRLDPRVKLVITLAFIFLTFFADNWQSNLLLFAFIFFLCFDCKNSLWLFFKRFTADALADHFHSYDAGSFPNRRTPLLALGVVDNITVRYQFWNNRFFALRFNYFYFNIIDFDNLANKFGKRIIQSFKTIKIFPSPHR